MKNKFRYCLFCISLLLLPAAIGFGINEEPPLSGNDEDTTEMKGTAIVIAGAASRIPQEAALLEQLDKTGWLKNVTFISGVSSGALNTVMLNAIITGKFTWERYKKILFSLSNEQIYLKHKKKIPFDTKPLNYLLMKIIHDSLGYSVIGDLPIPSAVSAIGIKVRSLEFRTMRFSNKPLNPESNSGYDLVDVLMASTAIPAVFPPVKIKNAPDFPDLTFIDGGAAEDHLPYEALIQYINYSGKSPERLVIVNKKYDSEDGIRQELEAMGLKDNRLMQRLGLFMHQYTENAFMTKLQELQKHHPDLASRTYVYTPEFGKDFALLNFNAMKEQYDLASDWAKNNQPEFLSQYLSKHQKSTDKSHEKHDQD